MFKRGTPLAGPVLLQGQVRLTSTDLASPHYRSTHTPTPTPQNIDLYVLYKAVTKERGGFDDVSRFQQWEEVALQVG